MTPEIPFREGLDELASHYKQVLTLLGEDPEREGKKERKRKKEGRKEKGRKEKGKKARRKEGRKKKKRNVIVW